MKYKAFISYRHKDIDEVVARHVQKIIERYRVPKKLAKTIGKTHVGKVFRDSDELQAASNLSEIIRSAIEESEWLIVICTKRYKESVWCMEEIEHFVELNGREKVLVILVEGEPNESFPSILTDIEVDGQVRHIEPLAVDIRGGSEREVIKNLNDEQFRFLSTMLEVDYDDLKNRQRERRIRRIATAATAAFAILAVILGLIIKNNIELYYSNQETLRGESYFLSEYAEAAYKEGDRSTAIKLALSALPSDLDNMDRPLVGKAVRALTEATGVYDYTAGYHVDYSINNNDGLRDIFTSFSNDGSIMLIEKYYQKDYMISRRSFEVVRTSDGEVLQTGREADTFAPAANLLSENIGAVLSPDGKKIYYVSEERALTCTSIPDGKELYSVKAEPADLMRADLTADPGKTAIVTMDADKHTVYGYDIDGNRKFTVQLPEYSIIEPGKIDHGSGKIAIFGEKNETVGFYIIDTSTGGYEFYETKKTDDARCIAFTGKDILTFVAYDTASGIFRIAQYGLRTQQEDFISTDGREVPYYALTADGKIYYPVENKLYEIDCTSKKKLWEYELPSAITSICAGDGLVAAGMENGSVSVFEDNGKRRIPTPKGNGEKIFVDNISKAAYTTKISSNKSLRVYSDHSTVLLENAKSGTIAGIGGDGIPENVEAYPAQTNNDRLLIKLTKGDDHWLAEYDASTMEKISESSEKDLLGDDNLIEYYEQSSHDYFTANTMQYIYHFNANTMKEVYRADKLFESTAVYTEDNSAVYETVDDKLKLINAATGETVEEIPLPEGYSFMALVGDHLVMGAPDPALYICTLDGTPETVIEDGVIVQINDKRELLVYTNSARDTYFLYDVKNGKVLLESNVGSNCMEFFGNNRYLLRNASEVYDMDTWEQVLAIPPEDGDVYWVQTTNESPYFVFCRGTGLAGEGLSAYLYPKDGSPEAVGVINNMLAMSPDGEAIVYDENQTLYKIPILSAKEIIQKAKETAGDTSLSPEEKEKYHIFR